MKKLISISIIVTLLALVAFGIQEKSAKKATYKLITKDSTFVAANAIKIAFQSTAATGNEKLFINHSYGKTLLNAKYQNGILTFSLPINYQSKSGNVSWFLIANSKTVAQGEFAIVPNAATVTRIENYLGPRSILAGGKEFTMMVSVPTDAFDNPVAENTAVIIKDQFLDQVNTESKKTMDFIAWKNIFSNYQSGKLLVATSCNGTETKEIETEVYPNIATQFTISFNRNHSYADGNQITTLTSSVIKDEFGNTVSDGTLVNFNATTKNQMVLKTFGTTINGVAKAQLLHPDHADIYIVKAYITGIAESNSITLPYTAIISRFDYAFSNGNRTLIVGPLKSFMNQLVPDGIKVKVKVFDQNKLVATMQEDSYNGKAKFQFSADSYPAKNYHFEITTLGITQQTETKNYVSNKK